MKPDWQQSVLKTIEKRDISPKDFAKLVGCAQSTMHDLLHKPDASHSALVPRVHEVLGWDPPTDPGEAPPLPSADALEFGHMFDRLPEKIRRRMLEEAQDHLAMIDELQAARRNGN